MNSGLVNIMSIKSSLINLGNKGRGLRNTEWFQSKGFTPLLRNLIQAIHFASYVNGVAKAIENNRTINESALHSGYSFSH